MKTIFLSILFLISSLNLMGQERNRPVFSPTDSLNVFGEWQTKTYQTKKGEEFTIEYRFKVRKTFAMTCLYSIEIKNVGETSVKATFMAGNSRTN